MLASPKETVDCREPVSVNVRARRRSARVVVVGAGFAGASLLRNLPPALRSPGETLLIDRREEYTFVPLIHEVAVGRIHPRASAHPSPPSARTLRVPATAEAGRRPRREDASKPPKAASATSTWSSTPAASPPSPGTAGPDYFQLVLDTGRRAAPARSLGDAWRRGHEPGGPRPHPAS